LKEKENMDKKEIALQFNNVAEKYDNQRRVFIPHMDDYYGIVKSYLQYRKFSVKSVLDLGAGTGLLTKYVLEVFPEASYRLIDVAVKMLDIAKSRFINYPDIKYETGDYVSSFPEGKFDLIVSGLSIHHLDDTMKKTLYANILKGLNEGGCFINLDQFNADSAPVNVFFCDYWLDVIRNNNIDASDETSWIERRKLDKENSIPETVMMLKETGFQNVDCIYQFMKFGVIMALK
jgi:ubiquinone/menaquinone biosynthesis C-methylase UbiE